MTPNETAPSNDVGRPADGKPAEPRPDEGWLTRERGLALVLIAATVVALFLCYLLVQPFLPALAWALALAIVARPLYRWIAARIPNANIAAAVAVGIVALILFVPTILLLQAMAAQAGIYLRDLQQGSAAQQWRQNLQDDPRLSSAIAWLEENIDLQGELQQLLTSVATGASSFVKGSIWAVVQFLITLFALFYFFRDRRLALDTVRSMLPLNDRETDRIYARVADTIHATIYGTLMVALIQGALGGLMFWWLGLPAPLLWGVVMALLAVVPWLGAFAVWLPAAVMLALAGEWGKALVLTGWGTIVVGLIDNLLYPLFVGNRLRLHTLAVFFAIVGGLAVFGASGIILGPVVLALTDALVEVWRRRTAGGRSAEEGVHEGLIKVS